MHFQVLSSGSKGNSALVRAGETRVLVDAGLTARQQSLRLETAKVSVRALHHLVVSHGHLDHARSAGILGKRNEDLVVHCAERVMRNRSLERARRLATLTIGRERELTDEEGRDAVRMLAVRIPHDADPTVAFRFEHGGRRAVVLTDMGRPAPEATEPLADPHLLLLEFNHDEELLASGPYPPKLKKRIAGDGGHLSNRQAADVLRSLAGPNIHTLVLAHLSEHNNRPELALEAARNTLDELGLAGVRVVVASQHEVGENLPV